MKNLSIIFFLSMFFHGCSCQRGGPNCDLYVSETDELHIISNDSLKKEDITISREGKSYKFSLNQQNNNLYAVNFTNKIKLDGKITVIVKKDTFLISAFRNDKHYQNTMYETRWVCELNGYMVGDLEYKDVNTIQLSIDHNEND